MENVVNWVEKNPWLAGIIGIGGVLILLWLFGFFSSSTSQTSSSNGLAAAYYNAEAAQTTAGTQLQMATEAYAAQTAQDQIQATGAESIAQTQANMYTTLGQQNAGTTTALGNDQLLASENSNNDALSASQIAGSYALQTAQAGYNAGVLNNFISNVMPQELAFTGSSTILGLPGAGDIQIGPVAGPVNINTLEAAGYSPAGAAQIANVPLSGVA